MTQLSYSLLRFGVCDSVRGTVRVVSSVGAGQKNIMSRRGRMEVGTGTVHGRDSGGTAVRANLGDKGK